jgi:hypothetical protein
MQKQLHAFDELALRYQATVRPGDYIGDHTLYDELHRAEPVVRRILEAIDPAIAAKVDIDQFAGVVMARNEIQRGLGPAGGHGRTLCATCARRTRLDR